jgi:acyl-CoA synthetase (AMP-forming)/AMP-acid ligase II
MHLAEIVRRQANARPNDPSYTCAEGTRTWRQTDDRANRLANHLLGRGLAKGDRVALLAKACHRYWEVHFACAKAGLVAVPVNYRLLAAEIDQILDDVGASGVIVDARSRTTADDLRHDAKVRIGFGAAHGQEDDYERSVARAPGGAPRVDLSDDDLNVIAYTSGTTGRPKGAMLTHHGAVVSAYAYGIANRFTADDVVLSCMPAYVFRGQSAALSPALAGAHVIMADFRPAEILGLIERHRVTQIQLAPAMINMLLAEPGIGQRNLASVRALWTGGAPIRPATLEKLGAVFGDVLGSTFGMTEATGVAGMRHRLSGDPRDARRLASVGRPFPLLDVEVRRADGTVTADEEVGEIVVRGESVMSGYWNDPAHTADVLREGWYHTGDLAFRDSDGYLFLVDRRVDVIISGGLNVYSLEVEQVLDRLPGVAESAVIGTPHEVWGEAVTALVIRAPGTNLSAAAVIAHCRDRLAHFKAPQQVIFVEQFPRNAMGKLDKKALRAPFWAGEARAIGG